ncbi:MAG TPA: TIGR04282 family arsenosugar biosynthesis glycosyltransferase [Pirellulales bacterium]|nr:TIGR04282 family arsenosugar biosynthesis glycosyltransferase [Pirellulales bacterium]
MVRQFGIFAKYWQPGRVKTRLAGQIGAVAAAELHRACLDTLLRRFAHLGDRRVLAFTPPEARQAFADLAGRAWQAEPQCEGDLGDRIEAHFATAFARGATRVVLIGSDSPTLPDALVVEAFERLKRADAVVGPSDDGGYYLIGLARPLDGLFRGLAWSTPQVFRQTLERLDAAGSKREILAPWYDIDTPSDFERLKSELAGERREVFAALRQRVTEL